MLTGTKQSIYEIDAFLNKSTLGRIIIDNNKAYLYTDDQQIEISSDDDIKIANGYDYIDVTYNQLINTICDDGWPLFAGKTALVKDC